MAKATQDQAEHMLSIFMGNQQCYGTHGEPDWDDGKSKWGIRSTAKTYSGPTTAQMWLDHLLGTTPLGIVPIMRVEEGGNILYPCWWGSIDVDDYKIDDIELVRKIQAFKYPLVTARSKSGGLHLFLFLSEPSQAAAVQAVLRDMAASMGLAGSEIFPKQTRIIDPEKDKGSWIVMPYFGDTFDGKLREQNGIKPGGSEMTLSEFLRAADAARTTLNEIRIKKAPKPRVNGHRGGDDPAVPFGDGPPCLQHLAATKVAEGGQDLALFAMGVYFKKAYPDDWEKHLEVANREYLTKPGTAEYLSDKIKSLRKKDYFYKCKDEPLLGHCNSILCRTREYGVKGGTTFPNITSMSKYDTKPPMYYVEVDGFHLELTADQLLDYRRFAYEVFTTEGSTITYGPMKDADWKSLLAVAMQNCEMLTPDPESGDKASFMRMLRVYVQNKSLARTRSELATTGKPWQDKEGDDPEHVGWYYLSVTHFEEFMTSESVKHRKKSWTETEIRNNLKKNYLTEGERQTVRGPSAARVTVYGGGKFRNIWRFAPDVFDEPSRAETPSNKETKI